MRARATWNVRVRSAARTVRSAPSRNANMWLERRADERHAVPRLSVPGPAPSAK